MKRIVYLIMGLIVFASCDQDLLNTAPLDKVSSETFFTNEEEAEMFALRAYDYAMEGWNCMEFFYNTELNGINRDFAWNGELGLGTFGASSGIVGRYWNYSGIRHCYEFMSGIEKIDIDQTKVNELNGIIQYTLAFQYFTKFRAYEAVPIVNKIIDLEESDLAVNSKEEVFAEALKQVNQAIQNLPLEIIERGRLSKGAAMALKADMLLYAASRFDESISGATFLDAANAAKAIIDLNKYDLTDNYIHLFKAEYQSNADVQKEVIFEDHYVKEKRTNGFTSGSVKPYSNGGSGILIPTQIMIDKYECTDGLPVSLSPLYDSKRPFKNRDSRLGQAILYPGNEYFSTSKNGQALFNSLVPEVDGISNKDYVRYPTHDAPFTGYVMIKYWDQQVENSGWGSRLIYRYADILLMYAEALNEVNGPSSEVYNAISQVRQRAGMPAVDATTHPTQADVRQLVRNERVVELSAEGKHYWDLRRWGTAENEMNVTIRSINIKKYDASGNFDGYEDEIYVRTDVNDESAEELFEIPSSSEGGFVISKYQFNATKHYVWPIPQYALDRSEVLEQNPVWK